MKNIRVGIIGASGYGAAELLRLLDTHPAATVVNAVSSSSVGISVTQLHKNLSNRYQQLHCTKELDSEIFSDPNIPSCIFTALPHGHSGTLALSLFRNPKLTHVKIIDLSGDLRFKERALAEQWYPETEFVISERKQIAYGLAEMFRDEIRTARLISNPGCLATAAILALAPLMTGKFVGEVAIDAKTGTSGAGRSIQEAFHHPGMNANCFSYKVLEHRHEAEIREVLGDPNATRLQTTFVPTVLPTSRGIYATCYLSSDEPRVHEQLIADYQAFYSDSPFIKIREEIPELRSVIGSNCCEISIRKRGRMIVIISALDNLIKGMAGSAIQNMNLSFGLEEHIGLPVSGFGVI